MSFLKELKSPLDVNHLGYSIEGKAIKMVSYGSGKESVLLWSQMHGNESTATMALMDIFNFLSESDDSFDDVRKTISENLSVHFIPMLNPDGADRFERRNSQGIDINRDALRLQTPEGNILKLARDSLNADWGFNLHDQSRNAYVEEKPATISVLAPAYNFEKSINEKRGNAMQLTALMNEGLQRVIPQQVSQYSDDFEPRAFGDNVQKWGTRTILIESGGFLNDREKQVIRKLNFMMILSALHGIASKNYTSYSIEQYKSIPKTKRGYRDVIVKNIQLPESMGGYLTDIAFNFQEVENGSNDSYSLKAVLVDIGDLSTSKGYLIHDVEGFTVRLGKNYPDQISDIESFKSLDLKQLLSEGFTTFSFEKKLGVSDRRILPIKIVGNNLQSENLSRRLRIGSNPSLLFYKGDKLESILVNGYFFLLNTDFDLIVEGLNKL
jgi:hypothetical protein